VDIAIEAPEFQGRRLMVRTASWFRGPRLVVDGSEVKGKRGLSAVSWRFRGAPRSFVVRVARLGSSCSAASSRSGLYSDILFFCSFCSRSFKGVTR